MLINRIALVNAITSARKIQEEPKQSPFIISNKTEVTFFQIDKKDGSQGGSDSFITIPSYDSGILDDDSYLELLESMKHEKRLLAMADKDVK